MLAKLSKMDVVGSEIGQKMRVNNLFYSYFDKYSNKWRIRYLELYLVVNGKLWKHYVAMQTQYNENTHKPTEFRL